MLILCTLLGFLENAIYWCNNGVLPIKRNLSYDTEGRELPGPVKNVILPSKKFIVKRFFLMVILFTSR